MSHEAQLSTWAAHLAAAVQATPCRSARSRVRAWVCVRESEASERSATSPMAEEEEQEPDHTTRQIRFSPSEPVDPSCRPLLR